MSILGLVRLGLLAAVILGTTACPFMFRDREESIAPSYYLDAGVTPMPCAADMGPRDFARCKAACSESEWVIDELKFPTSSMESQQYALKVRGKEFNSFGGILGLVASQDPSNRIMGWLGGEVASGQAPNLFRLGGLSQDGGAMSVVQGQVLPGKPAKCCDDPDDLPACTKQAKARCFDGAKTFQAEPTIPAGSLLQGRLKYGGFSLGPGSLGLLLGQVEKDRIWLPLKHATLSGTWVGPGEISGVLNGAIPLKYLRSEFVLWVANGLNEVYNDSKTDQQKRDLFRTLFDANRDGVISATELSQNGLFRLLLAGDVDVDCDGKNELSIGLGFHAVRAKIVQ